MADIRHPVATKILIQYNSGGWTCCWEILWVGYVLIYPEATCRSGLSRFLEIDMNEFWEYLCSE